MAGNARRLAAVSPGWGGRVGASQQRGRIAFPFTRTEAAMTHGKRRDIRTAIRTKREEPFNLWAFIVALQVPPLSALTPHVCSPLFFQPNRPFEPLFPWTLLTLTLFPSLFEPCPTVYKVALLNWKPQLCRSYRLSHPPLPTRSSFLSSPLSRALFLSSPLLSTILLSLPF